MSTRSSRNPKKSPDKSAQRRLKGKKSKQALVADFIDNEAEESDGMSSDLTDEVDAEAVEPEDLDSTPPPNADLSVKRVSKAKARSQKKVSSKKVVVIEDSSSEEDLEAMADDDSMYAAPSGVDKGRNKRSQQHLANDKGTTASASKKAKKTAASSQIEGLSAADIRSLVAELITDMFGKQDRAGNAGQALQAVDDVNVESRAVQKARVLSPSPDVPDPIDYDTAQMAEAIAESVAMAQGKRLVEGEGSSSGAREVKQTRDELEEGGDETAAETVMKRFAMAATDPETIAAGAAYVNKVAAPHDLALRQAMDIKTQLANMAGVASHAPAATVKASDQSSDITAALAQGAGVHRTLADFMGVKSAAYVEQPVNLATVLSDLETYKANYNAEVPCGVADPELQDPVLQKMYLGLPPLPGGRQLLPSYKQTNDVFNYGLSGGHVEFSLWPSRIPSINFNNSVGGMLFDDAPGSIINPSRVDPRRVATQALTADLSRYVLLADGKIATCVSCLMSYESVLLTARAFGRARARKWLSGLFHNQDYERFVSFMCLVFGHATLYGQLANATVSFQTALGPSPGSGAVGDISKSGVVSPQKGFVPAQVSRTSLAHDAEVPIYDGRDKYINFKKDLGRLGSVLPRFEDEVPFGSFVIVGYTATMWTAVLTNSISKIRQPHLGCNIMWVIVVGIVG